MQFTAYYYNSLTFCNYIGIINTIPIMILIKFVGNTNESVTFSTAKNKKIYKIYLRTKIKQIIVSTIHSLSLYAGF